MLDFRILGPLEVLDGERPVPLGGQKQRAVLALLLLTPGSVVSTDRLIDALWGETPPPAASASLQNFVSQLRKLLGAETLVTRPPGYVLHVDAEQLDAFRFTRLAEEARGAEPRERAARLREALGLWRGPALADFAFDAFAAGEIQRLEDLRLAVLEERIDADLEAGADAQLVGELEALVAEHPLRERLSSQLMLALYRSGRQADALEAYQRLRRSLVEELGIEPSPAAQRLHGAILRQESGLELARSEPPIEDHGDEVLAALLAGRVVPVLGHDVRELASSLAERFEYGDERPELARISQFVLVMRGSGPLYDELHSLLDREAAPTPVHRFLASLPPILRERGAPHQLIVTTSYDLALERAFAEAGEEFDVVFYIAVGRHRGRFCHLRSDGSAAVIEVPNRYASELSLEERTIILKLHGRVDRSPERAWESFVVTEDDHIDYLAQVDVSDVLPVALAARLRRSHFLFLGYRMADWDRRVILHRLWGEQALTYRSWAVQPDLAPLERAFWRSREIDTLELPLDEYVERLSRRLGRIEATA